ncbi:MAG: hypothetical protein WDZ63_13565 [Burkholderiales bacterium]
MDETGLGLLVLAVPIVVAIGFALYVWALVNAAQNAKWVWFVLVLLVWPLCFPYLLFAYERPGKRSRSHPGHGDA